jgi:23S rRNA pseudouridine1911/1915/1917 synthase
VSPEPRGGPVSRRGRAWTVSAGEAGQRLDKFLADVSRAGSRSRANDALARGRVFLDDIEAAPSDGARIVDTGDVVRLWVDRPGSASRPVRSRPRGGLQLLYQDDDLVVADKPAGLLTVPLDDDPDSPSALELLRQRFRSHGGREPLVVHRIDRDTSGVVLFALNRRARGLLAAQFADRAPERVYLAIVHGHPHPSAGHWADRLVWDDEACLQRPARPGDPRAVDAMSDYRVVEAFEAASLIEVRLQTGRQGQIRVQAQLRGHPLAGDRRYGPRGVTAPEAITFPRQALHAHRLVFAHPADRRRVEVTAPPPSDFEALVTRLRRAQRGDTR